MLGRTRLWERRGKLKKPLSGTGTAGICKQGASLSFSSLPPPPLASLEPSVSWRRLRSVGSVTVDRFCVLSAADSSPAN